MSAFWGPAPILVAGPCVLESDDLNLRIAEALAEFSERTDTPVIFKGSFDKANRSRADAPRGLGLEEGLRALQLIHVESELPVLTDVHTVEQAVAAAQVVNALQVPAFLCRQTDLLEAVGKTGLPANVKKGQWMSAEAMGPALEKVRLAGGLDLAVTERGTFFGYGDLVVDMRNFDRLRLATGATVLFDATHAVQRPGLGEGGATGGTRSAIPSLLWAAAGAGVDGFFLEVHPEPDFAPSDSTVMWPLDQLDDLLEPALDIWYHRTDGLREEND